MAQQASTIGTDGAGQTRPANSENIGSLDNPLHPGEPSAGSIQALLTVVVTSPVSPPTTIPFTSVSYPNTTHNGSIGTTPLLGGRTGTSSKLPPQDSKPEEDTGTALQCVPAEIDEPKAASSTATADGEDQTSFPPNASTSTAILSATSSFDPCLQHHPSPPSLQRQQQGESASFVFDPAARIPLPQQPVVAPAGLDSPSRTVGGCGADDGDDEQPLQPPQPVVPVVPGEEEKECGGEKTGTESNDTFAGANKSCVAVATVQQLLQTKEEETFCPSGYMFSVYDADLTLHFAIPSERVAANSASLKYATYHERYGQGTRFRFQLCTKYTQRRCTEGKRCTYIHARVDVNFSGHSVHVNENLAECNTLQDVLNSLERPLTNKHNYRSLPEGVLVAVHAPNAQNEQAQLVYSGNLLVTLGGMQAYNTALGRLPASNSNSRPRHCAHFQFRKVCNMGEECHYVHSLTPYLQPRYRGNSTAARPTMAMQQQQQQRTPLQQAPAAVQQIPAVPFQAPTSMYAQLPTQQALPAPATTTYAALPPPGQPWQYMAPAGQVPPAGIAPGGAIVQSFPPAAPSVPMTMVPIHGAPPPMVSLAGAPPTLMRPTAPVVYQQSLPLPPSFIPPPQ